MSWSLRKKEMASSFSDCMLYVLLFTYMAYCTALFIKCYRYITGKSIKTDITVITDCSFWGSHHTRATSFFIFYLHILSVHLSIPLSRLCTLSSHLLDVPASLYICLPPQSVQLDGRVWDDNSNRTRRPQDPDRATLPPPPRTYADTDTKTNHSPLKAGLDRPGW